MSERYFITEPVNGGYHFWDVRDAQDEYYQNRPLVTISADVPSAKMLAHFVLAWMKGQ